MADEATPHETPDEAPGEDQQPVELLTLAGGLPPVIDTPEALEIGRAHV